MSIWKPSPEQLNWRQCQGTRVDVREEEIHKECLGILLNTHAVSEDAGLIESTRTVPNA